MATGNALDRATAEMVSKALTRVIPGLDEIAGDTDLQSSKIDSIALVTLVMELETMFEVRFSSTDLAPQNFASPNAITALISRVRERTRGGS